MTLLTMNGADGQTMQVSLEVFNLKRWLERAPHCLGTPTHRQRNTSRRAAMSGQSFSASPGLFAPTSSISASSTSGYTQRFGTSRPALPGQRTTPRFTGARPRKRRLN